MLKIILTRIRFNFSSVLFFFTAVFVAIVALNACSVELACFLSEGIVSGNLKSASFFRKFIMKNRTGHIPDDDNQKQ